MRYKILSVGAVSGLGTNFDKAGVDLSTLVDQAIQEGWKPLGGVAVGNTQSTQEPFLFQAMIHE